MGFGCLQETKERLFWRQFKAYGVMVSERQLECFVLTECMDAAESNHLTRSKANYKRWRSFDFAAQIAQPKEA